MGARNITHLPSPTVKAGRRISAANEAKLREAIEHTKASEALLQEAIEATRASLKCLEDVLADDETDETKRKARLREALEKFERSKLEKSWDFDSIN